MEVNKDNFTKEVLESDKVVLIDFYAQWCPPCQALMPIINEIQEENKVAKIDIDESPDLASKYEVGSIPTLVFIKDGKEVFRNIGTMTKEAILEKFKELK